MRKIFLGLFIFIFGLCANASILPDKVSDIPAGTIGLYQTINSIEIFSSPKKSKPIYTTKWDYQTVSNTNFADNFFAVLIEKNECSYIWAKDLDEDFVEVIYNKPQNLTGWVYKEDNFQFLPWITYFNMYGRKYGLKILKEAPPYIYNLYSKSDKNSQLISRINRPKEIRLTAIQGNWALVTVLDIESVKTGYIQWRGENGELYLFPKVSK